jgi:hypothetical protein
VDSHQAEYSAASPGAAMKLRLPHGGKGMERRTNDYSGPENRV